MSMVSAFLLVGGAMAAPWYLIYLWVTFGNGFRYGTRFLVSSAVLGAAGFALVIHVTPVWREIPYVAYGLLAALVVLPAYVVRLIRQLTEAKAQAEAANRAKGRFLATVSHELRTPLTAIIGMGDMMMNTRLDGEQREMAATVNTSARQLLSLITDVLDFSQLEEAKLTIDQAPFDLYRVVCNTRLMLRGQARMKRLALRLVIDADVPRRIIGDDRRLQQALTNLLANAVKFTERGAVTLSVRLAGQDGAGIPGHRHRHRHSAPASRPHLRPFHPGGGRHQPPLWRHRPRPRDLAPACGTDGRRHRRLQRASSRQRILDHLALPPAKAGAGAAESGRRRDAPAGHRRRRGAGGRHPLRPWPPCRNRRLRVEADTLLSDILRDSEQRDAGASDPGGGAGRSVLQAGIHGSSRATAWSARSPS